jgi:hypothetical protein
MPAVFNFSENVRHLRKRIKLNKERHQLVTKVGFADDRFQRKVERVAGDLQEVCMSLLGRAKPRILQLLVSPEDDETGVAAQHFSCYRSKIEQRAVGVEYTGLHTAK